MFCSKKFFTNDPERRERTTVSPAINSEMANKLVLALGYEPGCKKEATGIE